MDSNLIRKSFIEFFNSKNHLIVPSAPMVIKNDPTLMFTNAGMNQFKDVFLGNAEPTKTRIANSQKCLRVSGKHNDLEEVGMDTYHHTMFEMLGNWSFGDYFKKEAIAWAWEFLTEIHKIDISRMYATVFGGDTQDGIERDDEAYNEWLQYLPKERILYGSKKDNFWEMGESGPCGPCSEIHVDIRSEEERKIKDGRDLVNTGHPQVIEIWNLVFIQFNRKADGNLENLPQRHVDTGMGFERLCMVLQNKNSNYDTDIFQDIFRNIESIAKISYGASEKSDIAMRVIADHTRAVSFAIADGQLPSNNKAGYVIRRILRRAIRYGFTFLNIKEPFIFNIIDTLVQKMGNNFPELEAQRDLIKKVITEEEIAFLKTLEIGIQKFENYITSQSDKTTFIDGAFAFELFDTYGFPIDLTELLAREKGWSIDKAKFSDNMQQQKERSRQDAQITTDDWVIIDNEIKNTEFVGWDNTECEIRIHKYRKISKKGKDLYHLVFDKTPFYAESGGQVGDRGYIANDTESILIEDTQKENELIVHICDKLPLQINASFKAKVDIQKRLATVNNHTATHLLHSALRKVLGSHVEQKGSHVDETRLRFDFSHFSKMSEDEIREVERIVNEKIRQNIKREEYRSVPMKQAKEMGATALFGEKYGDNVRVICFDKEYSIELCGGTHAEATGQIGLFKITTETAVAAGVRRIEAITAKNAENLFYELNDTIKNINTLLKNTKDITKSIQGLIEQNELLQKQISHFNHEKAMQIKQNLKNDFQNINGINFLASFVDADSASIKDIAFALKAEIPNSFILLVNKEEEKVNASLALSDDLIKTKSLNASQIIRDLAKEIQGGGGGQAFFATAGGKNANGIQKMFDKAKEFVQNI